MKQLELTQRALRYLQEIWDDISQDSFGNADRVIEDFYRAFSPLTEMPGIGPTRGDLIARNVLFWRVYSYLAVCRNSNPIRIVRMIHGKLDVKKLRKTL